uniref:Putative secreted protein n=1 Tax=Ixodes ricinus TaxID=34613 RepID=A0A6B0UH22_IXORI
MLDCFVFHASVFVALCNVTATVSNHVVGLVVAGSISKVPYNTTSQFPVVAPVAACVRCSKVSSLRAFVAGSKVKATQSIMESGWYWPSYSAGMLSRKKIMLGRAVTP